MKKKKSYLTAEDCPVCGGMKKRGEVCEACGFSLKALGAWREKSEGKK